MYNLEYNFYTLLIESYILWSICNIILLGAFYSTNNKQGYPILTKLFYFFSLQITFNSIYLLINQYPMLIKSWSNFIFNDITTYNIKLIILILFLMYCIIIINYNKLEKINSFEYWILILLSLIAFLLIVQINDFLIMYLSIEFQSLVFYILASYNRTSEYSTEAGLKYFILGAFSSALLLFGISLIYGLTGITNFTNLTNLFLNTNFTDLFIVQGTLIGILLIIVSLLFKLSAAPFHIWAPDIYEGSPTSVTALFSIFPKIIILFLLIKLLFFVLYDFMFIWRDIIAFSIICSSIIGTLSAFSQKKWKRFIAYSSINHISFWLLAIYTGDIYGCSYIYIYLIVYLIMILMLFIILLNTQIFKYPTYIQIRYFDSLQNLVQINPTLTVIITLLLFSMAGIPPMAGFFVKFLILFTALKSNIYNLVLFIIILNCIACFYYLRIIKIIYFDKVANFNVIRINSLLSSSLLSSSVLFIIFIFLDFELIFIIINLITKPFLI